MTRIAASHLTLAFAVARGFRFDKEGITTEPTETLRDEAARLQTEARELFAKAKNEGGRGFTADEQTAQDKRFSRLETIKKLVDDETRFAKLQFDAAIDPGQQGDSTVQLPTDPPGRGAVNSQFDAAKPAERAEFAKAVANWASTGEMPRKYATITTSTQSGVYLPREIAATVVPTTSNSFREAIAVQGMESVSIITTPTTADLKVPVATGSAGGVVAETATSETENTPSLSESINLNVSTYQSGSVYYSNQLLAAGSVDVVNSVVPTLRYEKELGLESAVTAAMIADAGITQAVTLSGITSAGLTYTKLVSLNRSLPKRFDAKKVILLSDDAYTAAEQLVDTTGNPILNRDTQNQELVRFNGTPVIRSSYLEAFGATKVVGVIISLLGFRLRDVSGENLARYTQVPAKPNQTGFNLFAYHAAGYAPSAVAKLKTSAS